MNQRKPGAVPPTHLAYRTALVLLVGVLATAASYLVAVEAETLWLVVRDLVREIRGVWTDWDWSLW